MYKEKSYNSPKQNFDKYKNNIPVVLWLQVFIDKMCTQLCMTIVSGSSDSDSGSESDSDSDSDNGSQTSDSTQQRKRPAEDTPEGNEKLYCSFQ